MRHTNHVRGITSFTQGHVLKMPDLELNFEVTSSMEKYGSRNAYLPPYEQQIQHQARSATLEGIHEVDEQLEK